MEDTRMYDILIVGAGPAGLTAAIYARRGGKTVLVLEKDTFGGQITFSPKLENYPGFAQISGNDLAQRMLEQAMDLGADVDMDTVTAVTGGPVKTVTGENGTYQARAVVIAAGARHRRLGLAGEDRLIGKGISFCAVCDGAFYRGKRVAVIGGGNSALQEASLLAEQCSKVTVVQNLAFLTGEAQAAKALKEKENVEIFYNTVVTAYLGEEELSAVELINTETGEKRRLEVEGLFLAIGTEPENLPFAQVAQCDAMGYIQADERCATGTEGIFVAGDCRTKTYRQVATAIADGAAAALEACRYLEG